MSPAADSAPARLVQGITTGTVSSTSDPEGLGRVQLQLPWVEGGDTSSWARVAAPMAGADRGCYFPPAVGDEVLVGFLNGDVRFPYVLGGLWGGKAHPPAGSDGIRVIRTGGENEIRFVDVAGDTWVEIKSGGTHIVVAHDGKIMITGAAIEISAAGLGTFTIDTSGAALRSNADLTVEAKGKLTLKGSPVVNG